MNCGAAIYGILSADSTLTAMLSIATAIYPDVAPQRIANPCIVYSESIGEFSDTKDGVSHLDSNMVQIDIYTSTVAQRNSISARVRTLLDRYSGTVNSIVVQSIQMVYSLPTVEPYKDENDKTIYRQTMDFKLRQIR